MICWLNMPKRLNVAPSSFVTLFQRAAILLAVQDKHDLAVAVVCVGIVAERPVVDRAVGCKRLGLRRLIALAFEASSAAGQPVPRAVFVKHPILAAVAIDAKSQRVGRAPAARLVVEPAKQHAAAPFGLVTANVPDAVSLSLNVFLGDRFAKYAGVIDR